MKRKHRTNKKCCAVKRKLLKFGFKNFYQNPYIVKKLKMRSYRKIENLTKDDIKNVIKKYYNSLDEKEKQRQRDEYRIRKLIDEYNEKYGKHEL